MTWPAPRPHDLTMARKRARSDEYSSLARCCFVISSNAGQVERFLVPLFISSQVNHSYRTMSLHSLNFWRQASSKRLFSTSTTAAAAGTMSTPHIAPIPGRSVLSLSGKDAQKFLKGLTSRNVEGSPGWGYSGFLTPTVRTRLDKNGEMSHAN